MKEKYFDLMEKALSAYTDEHILRYQGKIGFALPALDFDGERTTEITEEKAPLKLPTRDSSVAMKQTVR